MQIRLSDDNDEWLRVLGQKHNKSAAWLVNKIMDMVREEGGNIKVVEFVKAQSELPEK